MTDKEKQKIEDLIKEAKEIDGYIEEGEKDIKHMGIISFVACSIILLLYILFRYL